MDFIVGSDIKINGKITDSEFKEVPTLKTKVKTTVQSSKLFPKIINYTPIPKKEPIKVIPSQNNALATAIWIRFRDNNFKKFDLSCEFGLNALYIDYVNYCKKQGILPISRNYIK